MLALTREPGRSEARLPAVQRARARRHALRSGRLTDAGWPNSGSVFSRVRHRRCRYRSAPGSLWQHSTHAASARANKERRSSYSRLRSGPPTWFQATETRPQNRAGRPERKIETGRSSATADDMVAFHNVRFPFADLRNSAVLSSSTVGTASVISSSTFSFELIMADALLSPA